MSLAPGTRLGPYEILSALGAGGMGEVYKARDTRLDRTVAIKILPDALAADPQFRERFDREARAISQLEHPHICALYDVGEQSGTAYLVMQHLEGETLADRLAKGALPLDHALTIAIAIASALDKAHRAGIVHRDLKPGNIMLTKAGAKLLDFGLAKSSAPVVASAGLSIAPTTPFGSPPGGSPNLTAQGTILGTFQYMAPEQLEGGDADSRTDIFAFGAVLFEMLTGRRAFEGKSQASLIGAIMHATPPPIAASQPLTPPSLDRIVRRCLAKDPDERWQSAGDLMRELKWIAESGPATLAPASAAAPVARRLRLTWILSAIAGLVIGAAGMRFIPGQLEREPPYGSRSVTRVLVDVAPAEQLRALVADQVAGEGHPSRTTIAISPDGRSIVFSAVRGGRQQLYLRRMDQLDAMPMAGTEDGANPFFSPDGQWIGFWADGALKKSALSGGPPSTICETLEMYGASWGSNDTIVFARGIGGLWQVPSAGGVPRHLTVLDAKTGEISHRLPQILPGNEAVLFTVTHGALPTWDDTQIVVQSLTTGDRKILVEAGADARYVPTGHLLYVRRGTLMAINFDLAQLSIVGGPVALMSGLMQAANMSNTGIDSGAGQLSVSDSGSLLYVAGSIFPEAERSIVWIDRSGAVQPLPFTPRPFLGPRLSPDGQRLLVWTQGDRNVWLGDIARRTLTRFTVEGRSARAIWTRDGKRITFGSSTTGTENLFSSNADRSGAVERLTTGEMVHAAGSWSPDGQTLAFVQGESMRTSNYDIWATSLTGNRLPRPLIQTRFSEAYPEFSPDGHWLAHTSDESGREEVYIQPYPGPGARHQISSEGGSAPAWSHDGRELFYTAPRPDGQPGLRMMAVRMMRGPAVVESAPRMLFEGRFSRSAMIRGYDISPDSRRFLMILQKERPPIVANQMVLVQNWFEELRAKVQEGN